MTRPVTFLHLTDLHVGDQASDPGLRADTVETLRRVCGLIGEIRPRPGFIAVSGDLVNSGDAQSYAIVRDAMAGVGLPVLYALGNHDSRPAFYAEVLGRSDDPEAPYDHEAVVDGVHVITLDSSVPGRIGGALDDGQIAFLDAALSLHSGLPKLLMVHHPPALRDDPASEWESLTFADTTRLGEMIVGRGVVGVLSGHIHQDRVAHWRGAPAIVNAGQHCTLDPLFAGDGIRLVSGISFGLCTLRNRDLTVSFVSVPFDRRELGRISNAEIRAWAGAR